MIYTFGTYTLDTDRFELRRAGALCALEPHAVDILSYLLEHRERVVTKGELLEHLWPDRFVGEGILAQRLMLIRKAIGDSGSSQHCIKTVHGRGYRFTAAVTAAGTPPPPLFSPPPHFVGRDPELAQLAQLWASAQHGTRQVAFIVGEAGIGKTALVDAFVARLAATENLSVGRGQCMDQYGTGEPYLPVLEALGRLCRGADGDRIVSCLRHYAPSWLAHLSVLAPAERDALARGTRDATPARMLQELTDALEVLTAARPLVLVLEDLHWSDRATLAWLAYAARRHDPARVLILGTYRADEVFGHAHPLRPLFAALRPHDQCAELALDVLSAPAVAAYLGERCAATTLPANLPQLVHRRTGGHPLFVVAIVDELLREKRLDAAGDAGESREQLEISSRYAPADLRRYIEQQLERLADADRILLEAASAGGSTFSVAAAAAGVGQPPEALEARYAAFARRGQFIRSDGTEAWPDGTMTTRFQFKHALYHEAVYARLSAEQQLHLHQHIGARKEAGYGAQAREIAAELAMHFMRGGDTRRAVHYLHAAGQNALRRSAYQEAIAHLMQGLEMLAPLPDSAERAQQELGFLTTLGLALVATKGQAHAEVERAYSRARTLCHRLEAPAQLFQVLWGLFSFHIVRAELSSAREVGQQLLALAERPGDTSLRMVAHFALGQTLLFQGEPAAARVHLEQGIALYNPDAHQGLSVRAGFPGDLGVFCHCFVAHTLWHLGYPDQALERIDQALALARELAHPFSRALSLAYAAMLYQFRREPHRAHEAAEAAIALCRDQGFPYYLAWATILQGWALTALGQSEEGMARIRCGLDAIRATGAELRQPYYLTLLAEACPQAGQAEAALTMLEQALAGARAHGECWQEAELHRLRGELLLQVSIGEPPAPVPAAHCRVHEPDGDAAQCFDRAVSVARHQQARSLELRAAVSLARLRQQQGNRDAARELLAPIYGWFTEGFDTGDLQDAKALLDELG